MKATEILSQEHQLIKKMLGIMASICQQMEAGTSPNLAHLSQMVTFLRDFADKQHHLKEEELLFKELEAAGMPADSGPIVIMLYDHAHGRRYTTEMKQCIERMQNGDTQAQSYFIENAKGYIQLLNDHIFKEDNILFRMADAHLSEAQQKKLIDEFAKTKSEDEYFYQMAEELSEYYGTQNTCSCEHSHACC